MTETSVRQLVISGDYAQAVALVKVLDIVSSEEMRWAGLALFNVGQTLDARALLIKSRGRGCHQAGIELATVFRQLGDPQRARTVLDEVKWDDLTPFDRALALRELGVLYFAFGEMREAYQTLEDAWSQASCCVEENALLPGIAVSLANVCLAIGAENRALHFLDLALSVAHPQRKKALLAVRAACQMYGGSFSEAHATLATISEGNDLALSPTVLYFDGLLHRFEGHAARAVTLFEESIVLSRRLEELNTECYAELGACAAYLDLGEYKKAERHLARARAIPVPDKVAGLVELRQGRLFLESDVEKAIITLQDALTKFRSLGLQRECAWAYLHLAEAYLRLQQSNAAEQVLDQAMNCYSALGRSKAVCLELRGLPNVIRFLESSEADHHALLHDWKTVDPRLPADFQVKALGTVALLLDGQTIRPNASLSKTVELLCYLDLRGPSTLQSLLGDVFPDHPAKSARMYFHLIRNEISRLVPGVSIEFQQQRRVCTLRSTTVRVRTDIAEVLQHLNTKGIEGVGQALAKYRGPFLVMTESDWAVEERSRLEWLIIKVGLETLEDYYEQGEDQLCLDLARRLLEVEPLNEAAHGLLIRATGRLRGAVAARQELHHASQQFLREVGEVPPSIVRLKLDLSA